MSRFDDNKIVRVTIDLPSNVSKFEHSCGKIANITSKFDIKILDFEGNNPTYDIDRTTTYEFTGLWGVINIWLQTWANTFGKTREELFGIENPPDRRDPNYWEDQLAYLKRMKENGMEDYDNLDRYIHCGKAKLVKLDPDALEEIIETHSLPVPEYSNPWVLDSRAYWQAGVYQILRARGQAA